MNLIHKLNQYKDKYRFVYKANPGNAGDSVIASATYDFFDSNNFQFRLWKPYETYDCQSDILLHGGGGNLIEGLYADAYNFLN